MNPSSPLSNVASGDPTIGAVRVAAAARAARAGAVPVPAVPVRRLVQGHGPGKHCEFISGSEPKQPSVPPVNEQTRKNLLIHGQRLSKSYHHIEANRPTMFASARATHA